MIKILINDFIYEVKEEILSYQDLGEKKANEWEKHFFKWFENSKISKKNIKEISGKKYYLIKDESEIFDIADKYFYAVEQKKEEEYWKNFQ